jgi:hypothetical protein
VLDNCVRKRITVESAERVLRWSTELGILTKAFFTLGHPEETYEEAKMTNRLFWRDRRRIRLAGYHAGVRIYPGTYVEAYATERGLLPPGFRWSAPYVNLLQRKLFRPADTIPILLQPGLGLRELRRLRVGFMVMRLAPAGFVVEKVKSLLTSGATGTYARLLARGLRG